MRLYTIRKRNPLQQLHLHTYIIYIILNRNNHDVMKNIIIKLDNRKLLRININIMY